MTKRIIITSNSASITASITDIPEVPYSSGSILVNKTGSWRFVTPVFGPRPSPCNVSCPLANPIPEMMRHVTKGEMEEDARLFALENPFPAILGRVCPAFCEETCNRKEFDEGISIRAIERYLGDYIVERGVIPERRPVTGVRIAVVGSGPAGLSCAYFLTLLGHSVTVFEREENPGGILALGIPEYRLPRDILNKYISSLLELGVEIITGAEVEDTIPALKTAAGWDALVIATGAHVPKRLGIKGEGDFALSSGLDFIKNYHAGKIGQMRGKIAFDKRREHRRRHGADSPAARRRAHRDLPRGSGRASRLRRRGEGDEG